MQDLFELARDLMQLVREHNYVALYLLLSVEEAGLPLPLPSDTVVAYAGYLSTKGDLIWWVVFWLSVAGSITGSLPLYWLTRARGRPLLLRYGKYLHLNRSREERIESWLRRNASIAVFVGRIVPGMRVGTTAISGVFEIPLWKFLPALTLSAMAWWGFWLWLGSVVGGHLAPLLEFSPLQFVLAAAVIVGIVTVALYLRSVEHADREKRTLEVAGTAAGSAEGKTLEPTAAGRPD